MERFTRTYAYSPFEWNVLLEITLPVPFNGTFYYKLSLQSLLMERFTRNCAYSPF